MDNFPATALWRAPPMDKLESEAMAEEYKCAACGETFEKGRPDDEATAEFAELFPGDDIKDAAIVCDDCWQQMMTILPPPGMADPT